MIRIDCRGVSPGATATSPPIREACDCFVQQGYAILDHVLPPDKIRSLRTEFEETCAKFLRQPTEDSLEVGKGRYQIALPLAGGFADPLVYANPCVVALLREVLGEDVILEAFGAVVSSAGAEDQLAHRDAPWLFGPQISALLPAHALTFGFPLVEMNESHGTTAVFPGSHRWKSFDASAPAQYPTVPVGSCILWDFRLLHRGTKNRSQVVRPLVYATYARRWYQDPVNFKKKSLQRLVFGPDFLAGVPDNLQPLFDHVR